MAKWMSTYFTEAATQGTVGQALESHHNRQENGLNVTIIKLRHPQ